MPAFTSKRDFQFTTEPACDPDECCGTCVHEVRVNLDADGDIRIERPDWDAGCNIRQ